MILSICLNPSVDVALRLDKLQLGKINRTSRVLRVAGGKGNNVARVVKTLGEDVTVLQLLGGADGEFINTRLRLLNINNISLKINQATRRCIAIIDSGAITEVRERGPVISPGQFRNLTRLYAKQVSKTRLIVASGSLPIGVKCDAYANLIKIANSNEVPFFLDAKGEALRQGIIAMPTMVKINQTELAEWAGLEQESEKNYLAALQKIRNHGVRFTIVSLGKNGLLVNWEDRIYKVTVPKVKTVSTVGCGDATMAAIAVGYKQKLEPIEILRMGAAAGTAAALQAATGVIDLQQYQQLKKQVNILMD